jgi:hypothetical protein
MDLAFVSYQTDWLKGADPCWVAMQQTNTGNA